MSEYIYHSKGTPMQDINGEISLPRKEIVRCCDCKHYHDGTDYKGERYVMPYCLAIGALEFGALFEVGDDDFCSWGERKTVDA